jgi:predicted ATPase
MARLNLEHATPEEKPKQLETAFVYFIRKLSQSKPILIHLDDGQWLDDESLSYFQALSDADICPLIIISSCRYLEDGGKVQLELTKHKRIDIDLEFLGISSCKEMMNIILRLRNTPEETAELIFDRSMGNPLFIEQLSSYLLETGSINDKGEIIKELGYLSSFSISDIISSRIDHLTDKVQECLFSASVLGTEFNTKVLSEMLKTDLSQELEAGINRRIWKDLDDLHFIFSHILIKDIVYQRMMSEKLKELHKLAAEAMVLVLSDKLEENAEEIALHFKLAGMEREAINYFTKAGHWFRVKCDWNKSTCNLNIVLEITERIYGAEHPYTANSLSNLAMLYEDQGKYEQVESLLLRALEIREKVFGEDHYETANSLYDLAGLYHIQGKFELSESLHLRALKTREKSLE